MINPWFKFYGSEYLSDPKIGCLTPQERSCWITLLCLAGTSTIGGVIEYLTVEVLLQKSGIHFDPYYPDDWNDSLSILIKLEKMKIIKSHENGRIEILNWAKRQESFLTNAERQAKHREKKSNEKVTDVVTKVTLEENRIEKNNNNTPSGLSNKKMKYKEKTIDYETGKEVEIEPPKNKNKEAIRLAKLFDRMASDYAKAPIVTPKSYFIVLNAINTHRMLPEGIEKMYEDWFYNPKVKKTDKVNLSFLLSAGNINAFKATH